MRVSSLPRSAAMLIGQADISQPCPFCGERKAVARNTLGLSGAHVWIACLNCECEGPKAESVAIAAAAWNHRQGVSL